MAKTVHKELQELQVLLEHKEQQEPQVLLEHREQREQREQQVQLAP